MPSNIKELKEKIKSLENQLKTVKGKEAEVYTRIVGYYRSIALWNKGKREEYNCRKEYNLNTYLEEEKTNTAKTISEFKDIGATAPMGLNPQSLAARAANTKHTANKATSYVFFYSDTCPNCPPVKKAVENLSIKGESINASKRENFFKLQEFDIHSVPTLLLYSKNHKLIKELHSVEELYNNI